MAFFGNQWQCAFYFFLLAFFLVTFFTVLFFTILRHLHIEKTDDGRLLYVSLTMTGNFIPRSLSVNRNRRLWEIFRGLQVRASAPLMLISATR